MLDQDFLNDLLGKEDVSVEDKIKQIISEHDADTRGLLQKRDELLGSEKKLKEQLSAFEVKKTEFENKINLMEEELKKATSEDHKAYYDNQIKELEAKHAEALRKEVEEKERYKRSHLSALRDKAIENGVKDINFVDGLKQGFIARVLAMNEFYPDEIDGQTKFLNKEHHTIEEVISSFALTQEGKAYIKNAASGGGATGSGSVGSMGSGTSKNPFMKDSYNLSEQMKLYKTNPSLYNKLKAEAGL